MGLPARALQMRLQWESEPPSWAAYLSAETLERVRAQTMVSSDSQLAGGAGCSDRLRGRVWELSQDAAGCREIQRAFDSAATEVDREMLAAELRGHVYEALRCPHANY